jgi:predicted ATPase
MLQEEFRARINAYRRPTGVAQTALARELSLHPNVLSHKLNGISGSRLTHQEVKQIIKSLAAWEAIATRREAEELLALMDLKPDSFSPQEWNSPPLNRLEETPAYPRPSLSTPPTSPARPNLPAPPNRFIGREWALRRVGDLLRGNEVRLLTLTGAGGTGKTRLALQVAQECRSFFSDGVYFANLAPITNPARLAPAIAKILSLPETGQDATAILKSYLVARQILLILDNFEQILEGAALVGELVEAAPRLKVLVTSREVLRLYGEYQFGVPPLDLPDLSQLPDLEDLAQFESIRLFSERARAVNPDFQLTANNGPLVAEICDHLEGLPLAIELAAARSKLLPPETLLPRLKTAGERYRLLTGGSRNQPQRQQTLKNAIEWSFSLLSGPEQLFFSNLAVFVNGWTEEAAAAICLEPGEPALAQPDLLELLGSLVDKSLVTVHETPGPGPRFRMLETLREYALEQLEISGRSGSAQQRHAHYFMQLAEKAAPRLTVGQVGEWPKRLEDEHDNLRAALAWAIEAASLKAANRPAADNSQPDQPLTTETDVIAPAEIALRLGSSLWHFWLLRGYFSEGRRWLELVSNCQVEQGLPAQALYLGQLYHGAGLLAFYQNDYRASADAYERSLNFFRQAGHPRGQAEIYETLAQLARIKGDYARARRMYREALAIFQTLNDDYAIGYCLGNFSMAIWHEGCYREAGAMMEQNLVMTRQKGFDYGVALMKIGLGMVAISLDNLKQGRQDFEEALAALRQHGQRRYLTAGLLGLGYIATRQGYFAEAEACFKEGFDILTGSQLSDRWLIAWYLEWIGSLALAKGQPEQAARLLGAADGIFIALNVPRIAFVQTVHDRDLALLQAGLTPAALEKLWAEGRDSQQALASKVSQVFS